MMPVAMVMLINVDDNDGRNIGDANWMVMTHMTMMIMIKLLSFTMKMVVVMITKKVMMNKTTKNEWSDLSACGRGSRVSFLLFGCPRHFPSALLLY